MRWSVQTHPLHIIQSISCSQNNIKHNGPSIPQCVNYTTSPSMFDWYSVAKRNATSIHLPMCVVHRGKGKEKKRTYSQNVHNSGKLHSVHKRMENGETTSEIDPGDIFRAVRNLTAPLHSKIVHSILFTPKQHEKLSFKS